MPKRSWLGGGPECYQSGMNRIKDLREARGLSTAALAVMVGTSQPQISRLEKGERKLTEDWMRRIAKALDVRPSDLLSTATIAEFETELQPYLPEASHELAGPLSARDLSYFKVLGASLDRAGITKGKVILVDRSRAAIEARKTGDILVVEVQPRDGDRPRKLLILRQFIAPALLTTNRFGLNVSFAIDTPDFVVAIKGVMVPEAPKPAA